MASSRRLKRRATTTPKLFFDQKRLHIQLTVPCPPIPPLSPVLLWLLKNNSRYGHDWSLKRVLFLLDVCGRVKRPAAAAGLGGFGGRLEDLPRRKLCLVTT